MKVYMSRYVVFFSQFTYLYVEMWQPLIRSQSFPRIVLFNINARLCYYLLIVQMPPEREKIPPKKAPKKMLDRQNIKEKSNMNASV